MCWPACKDPFSHHLIHLVSLPCGCEDVHRDCGCVCEEHAHLHCDGRPVAELEESR